MTQLNPDIELSLAVITGVFALLGVAVGHLLAIFAAWLDRKRRRNELLLAKLDDLAAEDQTILHWRSQIRETRNLLELQSLDPQLPCSRIESLTVIYFPALKQPVAQYTAALRSYYSWCVQQVPAFSADGTFPRPLHWSLIFHNKTEAERHTTEMRNCHSIFAESVASEAQRLLA